MVPNFRFDPYFDGPGHDHPAGVICFAGCTGWLRSNRAEHWL